MRNDLGMILLAVAVGTVACSGARPATLPTGSLGNPDAITPGPSSVATALSPGVPPPECGYDPPGMGSPSDREVVSGLVPLEPNVLEGPCNHEATTVLRIFDAAGQEVAHRCAWPFESVRPWNTRAVADGEYSITTQRACYCSALCAETATLHVTVRNAHGP